jgi:hypothetical protein
MTAVSRRGHCFNTMELLEYHNPTSHTFAVLQEQVQ